ncbi:hypothetical protein [Pseudactinotalea sp. Z1748]|uniref:hypothetical protein n=1 Tax=Pseudactinotalea sp. Z1748 TaxID=3413027 RepID=UPI003C7B9F37
MSTVSPGDQIITAATDFVTTKFVLDGMSVDGEVRSGIEMIATGVLAWLGSRAGDAGAGEELRSVLICALAADQVKGTYPKGPGPSAL